MSGRHADFRGFRHPRHDLLKRERPPIPTINADVEASPGGRNAAVGMGIDMKVFVPGIGPRQVCVMTAPQGLRLGHAGVLDEHPIHIEDGTRPGQALS